MANKFSSGISWSLTAQDIIELLKDPNSVIYKALIGFLTAVTEIARASALIAVTNAMRDYESSHPGRGVRADVDNEVFSPKQLPSDLIKSAQGLPQKEEMIDQKIKELTDKLVSTQSDLVVSKKVQLDQFNQTMGPKYQLTAKEQESLTQSYNTVVAQTEKAVPAELKGEAREKLVENRSAVGMEMNLMIALLNQEFKPSQIKAMVAQYKAYIGEYVKAEHKHYEKTLDIKNIEIELFSLKMTRGMVRSCATAQKNLDQTEESANLSRMKNPLSTKLVPPVK